MTKNILVAGASGRTGRIIVNRLIHRDFFPHVLVRDLPTAKLLFPQGVIFHQGDVRLIETLYPALNNIDAVISAVGCNTPVGKNCPKRVDYQGVVNLVLAACNKKIKQFVLISSIAVSHPEHPLNRFGRILDWKLKGENSLRESGVGYTIIRPGGLVDTPGGERNLVFDQGDRIMGTISRADLAETCIHALHYSQSLSKTFEVIEANHNGKPNWEELFSSLTPD